MKIAGIEMGDFVAGVKTHTILFYSYLLSVKTADTTGSSLS